MVVNDSAHRSLTSFKSTYDILHFAICQFLDIRRTWLLGERLLCGLGPCCGLSKVAGEGKGEGE